MTSPARLISISWHITSRCRLLSKCAPNYRFTYTRRSSSLLIALKLGNFGNISALLINKLYICVFRTYKKRTGPHNIRKNIWIVTFTFATTMDVISETQKSLGFVHKIKDAQRECLLNILEKKGYYGNPPHGLWEKHHISASSIWK